MADPVRDQVVFNDVEIIDIVIPVSGAADTIKDLIDIANGSEPSFWANVVRLAIVENDDAFIAGKTAGLASDTITRNTEEGLDLDMGKPGAENWFVESADGSTVAATVLMYTNDQSVDWVT